MQHRITRSSKLLNEHGELKQKGYATKPLLKYNRSQVAKKHRLKEWDYYLISNREHAVALTVGRSGTLLLISASFINLKERKEVTKTTVKIVSNRKFRMPVSSEAGDILFQDKKVQLSFMNHKGNRELNLSIKGLINTETIEASFVLSDEPEDSMVIATPFKKDDKLFYYNQKMIGMRATGTARVGTDTFSFRPENTYALLDWGRGVWPYHTSWYWGVAQGKISGNLFGFNLGYGFGDTSAATENMLFFNGIASKLKNVTFHLQKNDKNEYEYMKPWIITSSNRRIELVFIPILDRSANLSAVFLSTNQHQVFGKFTGSAVLDDGTVVFLQDFMGFAERVDNRW